MTPDQAREFVASNHRAVMITRRSAGGLQTSPVTVGADRDGKVVISSRETAYKVRNLRRHPTATLCVFTDDFFGPWVQIDGAVQIVPLPEAMEGLIDYYRRISGEHPDWDDYRRAMVDQRRVLIRLSIDNVGPTRAGWPQHKFPQRVMATANRAMRLHAPLDRPELQPPAMAPGLDRHWSPCCRPDRQAAGPWPQPRNALHGGRDMRVEIQG